MRGTAVRRAVAASVGLHALLVVVLVVAQRFRPPPAPEPARPRIDTRAPLRLDFTPIETSVSVALPLVTPPAVESPPVAEAAPPAPAPAPSDATGPPLARVPVIPRTLPPELLALMRKPAAASDVVEVPVTAVPLDPPTRPAPAGAVRPAAGVAAPPAAAASREPAGVPVHGALGAGQTVVYVLDASGSMGEWGKFDAARRALVATLKAQPATVRFQVVVYAGFALVPLPAPATGCVPATADNVTRMADSLRALAAPVGRSDHAAGLRAALELRPDVVLFLTDADDPPPAAVRGLVRNAGRPTAVCVARVGAGGVAAPRDWK